MKARSWQEPATLAPKTVKKVKQNLQNPSKMDAKIYEKSIKLRPGALRAASGAPGGTRNIKKELTAF